MITINTFKDYNAAEPVDQIFVIKNFLHENEIEVWFHGHVHSPADYRIAGARILCNPRGYIGKKLVPGFDPNRVVDI